jgi:hypothetical protein
MLVVRAGVGASTSCVAARRNDTTRILFARLLMRTPLGALYPAVRRAADARQIPRPRSLPVAPADRSYALGECVAFARACDMESDPRGQPHAVI